VDHVSSHDAGLFQGQIDEALANLETGGYMVTQVSHAMSDSERYGRHYSALIVGQRAKDMPGSGVAMPE
jgi:hypothetical protein